ncbi:hypothetical protein KI387_022902, partial [Taxus chinensis]
VANDDPMVTHLLFVDDIGLARLVTIGEAQTFKQALDLYEEASDQKVALLDDYETPTHLALDSAWEHDCDGEGVQGRGGPT